MKTKYLAGVLLISMVITACHQGVISPTASFKPPVTVIDSKSQLEGINPGGAYYMLPKTGFEVIINVKKTELVKGPYAAFAGKYLGIDNVINSNITVWQIDEIAIKPFAVPDTAHLYFVSFEDADSSSIPLSLQLNFNNTGALTGSSRMEDTNLPESTSLSVSGIGYSNVFKFYAESNLFEIVDTIVEKVSVDSITVEQTVLKRKMVEKPMEQRAKEAADFIQTLKDQRLRLLTGYQEIPYDPVTMKYMAGELERMEQDYIELFTGLTVESTFIRSFYYTPDISDDCIPKAMARFSYQDGILPLEVSKGETMYISFCSQGVAAAHRKYVINDTVSKAVYTNNGFVYRIPEWVSVNIYLGNKVQKEIMMQLPQFGTTARLPWFITRFTLDPETGALLNVRYP